MIIKISAVYIKEDPSNITFLPRTDSKVSHSFATKKRYPTINFIILLEQNCSGKRSTYLEGKGEANSINILYLLLRTCGRRALAVCAVAHSGRSTLTS